MLHVQILATHEDQPPPIDTQRIIQEVEEHFDKRLDEMEEKWEKQKAKEKESDHRPPPRKHR
jgi:sugar-specific transcriptional regulator TrmB